MSIAVSDVFQERLRPQQCRPRWHPSLASGYLQHSVAASGHGQQRSYRSVAFAVNVSPDVKPSNLRP